jgi:hypothetical protein
MREALKAKERELEALNDYPWTSWIDTITNLGDDGINGYVRADTTGAQAMAMVWRLKYIST